MSAPPIPAQAAVDALPDCRAYLRITLADQDAALAGFAATALAMAEGFLGLSLIARAHQAVLPVTGAWQRLPFAPVRAIAPVRGLPAEGAAFDLPTGDYAVDIDAAGDGWVRIVRAGGNALAMVDYEAGLASGWAGLPEPVRHGVVRLVAHLHGARDGSVAMPPAAVTALWRPWRRLRLAVQERAQKETTHNEALALIDIAVQPTVEAIGIDLPPSAPEPGQCWIVGTSPAMQWAGQAGAIAGWTLSGWRFVAPRIGMTATVAATGAVARFDEAGWEVGVIVGQRIEIAGAQVVGPRAPAIADIAGGSIADAEARTAIAAILNSLRAHGLIAT